MENQVLATSAAEERLFLHDLANPLAVAMLSAEGLVEAMRTSSDPHNLKMAEQLSRSLEKIRALLSSRREILKGRENEK